MIVSKRQSAVHNRFRDCGRGVRSSFGRALLVPFAVLSLVAGCGDTRPAQQPEGSVAFRSGTGEGSASKTYLVAGPVFQRPGLRVPMKEQVWQSTWVEQDQTHPVLQGATAGMTTGLAFLMMTPGGLLVFWPVTVGIMAGSTAMGMVGATQTDVSAQKISPPDRTVIADATKALQPERLFRESMKQALVTRAPGLAMVAADPASESGAAEAVALVAARAAQVDGLLEFSVDALGLAAGDERDMFGVFVQVRARVRDVTDGQMRYERVVTYGPGQAVEGLPRSDFHTIEFLAADGGRVYRQVTSQAIQRIARVLANDPQLPLVAPPK